MMGQVTATTIAMFEKLLEKGHHINSTHSEEEQLVFAWRQREQLRAENAELKRDAERLNWLESNPRHAQIVVDGKMTDCVFYGISCAALMKLRDAIDAAMKEQT